MANLAGLMGQIPVGGVHRQRGVMVTVGGRLAVNVWGNVLPAKFSDPLYLVEGDAVLVDITSGAVGQSEAFVVHKLTDRPRPATGVVTAVPASSDTIKVRGDDDAIYDAEFAGTYAVGNYVYLNWAAGTPTVVGKKGETKPPPPPPAPAVSPSAPAPAEPKPKPVTGSTTAAATWSGTFTAQYNIWNNWAGGNQNLFQGAWFGPQNTGAWFYGTKLKSLAGRRITRIRFRIGSRRSVGNYNATLQLHLYTHRSSSRPGGNVSLDDGPHNVSLRPRVGAQWVDLPLSFAPRLLAGGGIAIAGDPYLSITGRANDPESGSLVMYWEK